MSKRRSNVALKAKRSRSWQRGVVRRAERKTVQTEAHRANISRRSAGMRTIWDEARFRRAERRAVDPKVQERRKQHEAGLR